MNKKVIADTPVMKQFLDIKSKYNDTIILFRMGDFYETFLDDAVITSQVLGIVLTKRANGKAAEVNLAGFPHHSLDNYLPKLVKAGYRVAICEQVEDPKTFARPFVIPTKAKNTKDENSLLNLARMTADKKSGIFIKINNLLLLNLSIKKPATVKVITDITE